MAMLNVDRCWESVKKRDGSEDGSFFFGVLTTGVYCRPSCPCRVPLRKNVRFYESPADAESDGLRPCLRCRPLDRNVADRDVRRIRKVCRYMQAHPDENHKLAGLSAKLSLSPFHFQRLFKAVTGVTPKQYADALRLKRLKGGLRTSPGISDAIYGAGYGSSSRVYERAAKRLGMTPKQYRKGGDGVTITHVTVQSPMGLLMIGATDRGLSFVQFSDSEEKLRIELAREYPNAALEPMRKPYPQPFNDWIAALNRHLAGEQPHIDLPLDVRATAFQMRVWSYLQSIPRGELQSYSEVAAAIGQPTAARAVARACASNRVAMVIPCHRVIRGNGDLGGYRWGLARKRTLIDLERRTAAAAR